MGGKGTQGMGPNDKNWKDHHGLENLVGTKFSHLLDQQDAEPLPAPDAQAVDPKAIPLEEAETAEPILAPKEVKSDLSENSDRLMKLKLAIVACLNLPRSIFISSFFLNFLGLALPLVILQVYDRILPNRSVDTLALLMIGLAAVIVLDSLMKISRSFIMGWAAVRQSFQQEIDAVERIIHAPASEFDKDSPSLWMDRLDAVAEINKFNGGSAPLILLDLPFILIYMTVIFLVGGWLVGIPLFLIGVFGFLAVRRSLGLQKLLEQRAELDSRRYDFIAECLFGVQTVKSMAMEPLMQRRFERLQQASAEIGHKTILHGDDMQSFGNMFANFAMITMVSLGSIGVMYGNLSIGALACCTLLSGRIISPVLRGIGIWTELQNVVIAYERAQKLYELPTPEKNQIPSEDCLGGITFQQVSYTDAKGNLPSVSDISLNIKPGEFIGIRGTDESGVASMIKLMRGEIQPVDGSIYIDGHNVNGPNFQNLAHKISYVPARAVLFRGTLLENITMFKPGMRIDAAREAARLIGLEEEIHRLPEGYDTVVGDGIADKLPMGMIQRVAIARAIARQPKILILNQANSTLDMNADKKFSDGLMALRGQMTIIVVSNRPSLLKLTDRAYDMKDGKISVQEMTPQPMESRATLGKTRVTNSTS